MIINWEDYKEKAARCGLCPSYDGDPERSGECIQHGHLAMGWSHICSMYPKEEDNNEFREKNEKI